MSGKASTSRRARETSPRTVNPRVTAITANRWCSEKSMIRVSMSRRRLRLSGGRSSCRVGHLPQAGGLLVGQVSNLTGQHGQVGNLTYQQPPPKVGPSATFQVQSISKSVVMMPPAAPLAFAELAAQQLGHEHRTVLRGNELTGQHPGDDFRVPL